MKLLLKRIAKRPNYTIGKLYINGEYFCDTIEDCDRGVTQDMEFIDTGNGEGYWITDSGEKIKKVYSETAIPKGTYTINMNTKSQKYSNFNRYSWSKPFKGMLPRLENVPGYEGVLIHVGNTPSDSSGCILVGQNKVVGKVINSTVTFYKLMERLQNTDEEITITIE